MRLSKVVGVALSIVMLCAMAIGISAVSAQDSEAEDFHLFLGTVTGEEDIFIGLAVINGDVTLYICDGQADKGTVSVAEWFLGTVVDNAIDITAPSGNRVVVTIDGETATGTFTFTDGSTKDFVLTIPEDSTGLFRSDFQLGELAYVGGWLVLPDGTTRGAVSNSDTGQLFPASFDQFTEGDDAED